MINLINVIIILIAHYIGDFLLQTGSMANNKSHNLYWLLTHGFVYSLSMLIILLIFTPYNFGLLVLYVLINGIVHLIVDRFSSSMTTKYFRQNRLRNMFDTVGADQLIHSIVLLLTAQWILVQ